HRWMAPSELREDQSSDLPFVDFIRLVFRKDVSDAPSADRAEADAVWSAMVSGCIDARHYQLAGTDLFTYSQTRTSGERYHAFLFSTTTLFITSMLLAVIPLPMRCWLA